MNQIAYWLLGGRRAAPKIGQCKGASCAASRRAASPAWRHCSLGRFGHPIEIPESRLCRRQVRMLRSRPSLVAGKAGLRTER
jgi:hypothetical protein